MKHFVITWGVTALTVMAVACGVEEPQSETANVFEKQPYNGDLIDRMGRPEIQAFAGTGAMVFKGGAAKKALAVATEAGNQKAIADATAALEKVGLTKVRYNVANSFSLGEDVRKELKADMILGIKFFDTMDGAPSDDARKDELAELLVDDYLIVDTSHACSVNDNTFFDIERGKDGTCGGRTPNADVVDTTIAYLVAGGDGPGLIPDGGIDGIAQVRKPALDEFPYLSAPNDPPPPGESQITPPAEEGEGDSAPETGSAGSGGGA